MGKFTQVPESGSTTGPVAGLRGTGMWGAYERPTNFREFILWRNPNGTAPLTALMSKMGKEATTDPEFHWWDEPNDLVRLKVNGAIADGVATAITVYNTTADDPSVAAPKQHWGRPGHVKPGDILMVEKTTESALITAHELVRVVSVAGAVLTVTRGVAGSTAAAIANGSFLLLVGSSYPEGSGAPESRTRNPIKYTNYCQIFKTAYEITNTAAKVGKIRTGDVQSNDKKRKTFDHSRALEMSFMFGQAYEAPDATSGQPLRYMGGLREFIPVSNTTIFTNPVTSTAYLDALVMVFDYDTPAGDERIAFCGNGYLNNLNKLANLNGDIQFGAVIKQWGMSLREYILPQGRIYLRTHPLMNRHPQYQNSAFIVDGSALKYRYMRDTKSEDNIQLPGEDKKKGQWLTECSLEVRYAGLTCGYHGNFNTAA